MPEEKVDYSKTVLLPETAFPMKASLALNEPLRLKAWEESGVYARLREQRRGAPRWLLHDGPPFANGDIHMGTALNKVLKDVWIRYKTLRGFDAPYVPGWDTHGMPIEYKISRELKGKPVGPLELRKLCRAEAEQWVDKQRLQFKRLGVWGDWERPYITMDPSFESGQLDAYWALLKKAQVYRALKPVHWSWATQTALAEAELEYQDKTSTQVYVKYPLSAGSAAALGAAKPAFAVIWTTTPWTLPASLAITANEKFDYAWYEVGAELWLMAENQAKNVCDAIVKRREHMTAFRRTWDNENAAGTPAAEKAKKDFENFWIELPIDAVRSIEAIAQGKGIHGAPVKGAALERL
ncbi:MAG TPA: class I tRNA ligase family protein, partial [bacterium]|nr:class I tRNA ligase family protein [bacterium]